MKARETQVQLAAEGLKPCTQTVRRLKTYYARLEACTLNDLHTGSDRVACQLA